MPELKPINILMVTSEISSNPPRNGNRSTQWALVPLVMTVFCDVYILIILDCPLCKSSSTDRANTNNNEIEDLGTINLKPINVLMATGERNKTYTLARTFHKLKGEANLYVWFGYGQHIIF